jgi:5'-nucleotidase
MKLDEKNSQTSDKTDKLVNKADETKTSEQEQAKKSEESTKIIYVILKS